MHSKKKIEILYTGKYPSHFIFALVVSGQIKDWVNPNVANYLSLNKSGQIQDEAKLSGSVERRKLPCIQYT